MTTMMAWRYIDTDGLVHDDDTRKVWNETTTPPTLVRAYTTEEVAAAEQRASDFAAAQARAAALATRHASVPALWTLQP